MNATAPPRHVLLVDDQETQRLLIGAALTQSGFEVTEATDGEGALAHYNLGLAFRQQGYYREAVREYRLGLEAGESREHLRNAIAEVYLILGDMDGALEIYDELVEELQNTLHGDKQISSTASL